MNAVQERAIPEADLLRIFDERAHGLIDRIVNALRQAVPVEEIWLFGSCARGDAKPDSDLDLLVVLSNDHGLAQPSLACFRAVNHMLNIPPTDVVAISQSRWEKERSHPFGVFRAVAEEGICLYAK